MLALLLRGAPASPLLVHERASQRSTTPACAHLLARSSGDVSTEQDSPHRHPRRAGAALERAQNQARHSRVFCLARARARLSSIARTTQAHPPRSRPKRGRTCTDVTARLTAISIPPALSAQSEAREGMRRRREGRRRERRVRELLKPGALGELKSYVCVCILPAHASPPTRIRQLCASSADPSPRSPTPVPSAPQPAESRLPHQAPDGRGKECVRAESEGRRRGGTDRAIVIVKKSPARAMGASCCYPSVEGEA
ncbi:hypothetical protein DFH06DRAFT_603287 [Mycena polygramma]|nr:hypothetical protein DFH06DRAFT_603287 [Mycena polygramma]